MPGDSGVLVVTRVRSTTTIAHETAGALGIRHSPRPLRGDRFSNGSGALRGEGEKSYVDLSLASLRRGSDPDSVIPGRCEASNPESRDSPMRNCASEVWSGACHRAAQSADPLGPSRNDGVWVASRSLSSSAHSRDPLAYPEYDALDRHFVATMHRRP